MEIFSENKKLLEQITGRLLADQRHSGSYLFCGPEGLGKFEAAISLAKALACQKRAENEACLKCSSCAAVDKMIHPDVYIVNPENQEKLGIDEMRQAKHFLSFFPQICSHKIVIVNRADRLTEEAQNAFLKILEEPRGRAILILTTGEPGRLLKTILSRLFSVRFKVWPEEKIHELLLSLGAEENLAKIIARSSFGRPVPAREMFLKSGKPDLGAEEFLEYLDKSAAGRFAAAEEIAKDEEKVSRFLTAGLFLFRDLLLIKAGLSESVMNLNVLERAGKAAERYEIQKISEILKSISETSFLIRNTNVNCRLALENLMLML